LLVPKFPLGMGFLKLQLPEERTTGAFKKREPKPELGNQRNKTLLVPKLPLSSLYTSFSKRL